jgi:exoribonuclease R
VDNPQLGRKFVATLRKNFRSGLVYKGVPIEKQLSQFDLVSYSPENSHNVNSYYLAEYLYWPTTSRFPYGHIVEEIGKLELLRLNLGDAGLVEVETEALLRNYQVYNKDFGEETYDYLKELEK